MVDKRILREYLDKIRECEDPERLRNELKIYDNWPVLLYGNQDELFSRVTQAFRDSPKHGGIQDSWHYAGQQSLDCDRWGQLSELKGQQMFHFVQKKFGAEAQLFNFPAVSLYGSEEHRIVDRYHSIYLMFRGTHSDERKIDFTRGIALAVAGFGDYVIRENLTARFPKNGLDLNYVPEGR